jgi:Amidohydrolase family
MTQRQDFELQCCAAPEQGGKRRDERREERSIPKSKKERKTSIYQPDRSLREPQMLRARFLEMPGLAEDPRLSYIPRSIRDEWAPAKNILHQRFTPEDFLMARQAFPGFLRIVSIFHQAGVKFLAGTDSPEPNCLPGFSIHDELSLYVDAGLPSLEALRTATWNPAEFFGLTKESGSVEAGKVADLLLLDANPLADIHNTRKIAGVITDGRYYSRIDLDRILAQITDAVKQ